MIIIQSNIITILVFSFVAGFVFGGFLFTNYTGYVAYQTAEGQEVAASGSYGKFPGIVCCQKEGLSTYIGKRVYIYNVEYATDCYREEGEPFAIESGKCSQGYICCNVNDQYKFVDECSGSDREYDLDLCYKQQIDDFKKGYR